MFEVLYTLREIGIEESDMIDWWCDEKSDKDKWDIG